MSPIRKCWPALLLLCAPVSLCHAADDDPKTLESNPVATPPAELDKTKKDGKISRNPGATGVLSTPTSADPFAVELLGPRSLEQLVEEAMAHRPEIRLAEAKVKEAEAELARSRREIAKELLTFQESLDEKRHEVNKIRESLQVLEQKRKDGVQKVPNFDNQPGSLISTDAAIAHQKQELKVHEAALEKLERSIPLITGAGESARQVTRVYPLVELDPGMVKVLEKYLRQSGGQATIRYFEPNRSMVIQGSVAQHERIAATISVVRDYLENKRPVATGTISTDGTSGAFVMVDQTTFPARAVKIGPMAEKILEASKREVILEFTNAPIRDVLAFLRAETGINFLLAPDMDENLPVTLSLKGIPVSAALQAIEDTTTSSFIVRDYGILVTFERDAGQTVTEFIKRQPNAAGIFSSPPESAPSTIPAPKEKEESAPPAPPKKL